MSRNGMQNFLTPKRIKSSMEAGTFKCTASEALSCMPVSSRLLPMMPTDFGKCNWVVALSVFFGDVGRGMRF